MKKKLLLGLIFLSFASLTMAKTESVKSFKKPSFKQLYGAYKVTLGGALAFYSIKAITSSLYQDSSISLSHLVNNHFPEMLDLIFGTHLIYFGTQDMCKRRGNSQHFSIQKQMCDIVAKKCAVTLAKVGWNSLKTIISYNYCR